MRAVSRPDPGFDEALRGTSWNALVPDARPEIIAWPTTVEEVVEAVNGAREAGRQVAVRSGGHSWSANHVREGATLIDLGGMDSILEINREARTAIVQPGCHGSDLVAELVAQDLFFPVGHCIGPALGGYLLQGGFGWNGRVYGPACQSVRALDVVTADGEIVRASADSHPELYWAARGSGPGFPGVVVAFHIDVYELPREIVNCAYVYPEEVLDEVFTWAGEVGHDIPPQMEFQILTHFAHDGTKEIVVAGPTFADTEEEAREITAVLQGCPVVERAKFGFPYVPVGMEEMFGAVNAQYPDDHRWAVDNMWTHAPAPELIPGVREIVDTLPAAPFSHTLWLAWEPGHPDCPEREEMAFSVEDDTYIAAYGVWDDPGLDGANERWATERMEAMEHLATGIQLADENLARRTGRFMTDANYERYDQVRDRYDPDGLFCTWASRP